MNKKKFLWVTVAVTIAVIIGLTGCGTGEKTGPTRPLLGDFNTQQLNGEVATSEVFAKSKLTMINVWATFCTPCINEMPDLGEISREYKSEDFQIVGLVSDVISAKEETATEIVNETKADYIHLVADKKIRENFLNDVQFVPTTVFVDSEGKQVGDIYTGSRSKENWIEIIEEMRELIDEK